MDLPEDDELDGEGKLTCGSCRRTGAFTSPISVILVFAPGLERPYPLIPAEDYRVCGACDAVYAIIDRAASAHPATSAAGPWSRAILVFTDGQGFDVKSKREELKLTGKVAMA